MESLATSPEKISVTSGSLSELVKFLGTLYRGFRGGQRNKEYSHVKQM